MTTPRDRVQFTRESAERIADVVRTVELAPTQGRPLVFDRIPEGRIPKVFRLATYTGTWGINQQKTVSFFGTTNTVAVQNLFFPVSIAGGTCAIAKAGTAWYLVDVKANTATAVFVSSTQQRTFVSATASQNIVTGVQLSGSLNTSNCSITIGQTLTTASVSIVGGTATSAFVTGTYTATYVTGYGG